MVPQELVMTLNRVRDRGFDRRWFSGLKVVALVFLKGWMCHSWDELNLQSVSIFSLHLEDGSRILHIFDRSVDCS